MTTVPYVDLQAHHAPMRQELLAAIEAVLDDGRYVSGPVIEAFEQRFAHYCTTRHAIGVSSGAEALLLSLLALGVGPGHEVITVPNSFFATAEAISRAGAKPVFVDVDETTGTMDPNLLERTLTPATRAIIPVHLYGHPADMDPICEIAKRHSIPVIEDACQAHGTLYKGRKAGALGDVACFSFYPGKNLGALGDAGAVVTNDETIADRVRALRDHGQTQKHVHQYVGWTGRMDAVHAAVLSVKLGRLDACNAARRAHAEAYTARLRALSGLLLPAEAAYAHHAFHVYAVRTTRREELAAALTSRGVAWGVHYPVPIHRQPAYEFLGLPAGSYPVAERLAAQTLSLPMYPELSHAAICQVTEAVTAFHAHPGTPYERVA